MNLERTLFNPLGVPSFLSRGRWFSQSFGLTSIHQVNRAPGWVVGPGGTERIAPGSVVRWSRVCSGAYPGRMILGSEDVTLGWSPRAAKVKAASGNWSSPLPWTLTPTSQIIFLSCVMKSKMRQVFGFSSEAGENPDTQALLTCAEKEEENQEAMTEARSPSWTGPTGVCAQHGQRWRALPGPSLGVWGSLRCGPASHFKELLLCPMLSALRK